MRKLVFLSAKPINTASHSFYIGDTLESMRQFIEVLAVFDDGTKQIVDDYIIWNNEQSDIIESTYVYVEYRGAQGLMANFNPGTKPSGTPIYSWDFTRSFIDERQGVKAVPISCFDPNGNRHGDNGPRLYPGTGAFFGSAEQAIELFPTTFKISDLYGKTIKIDLPYFGATESHYNTKLLTAATYPRMRNFDNGIIYRWVEGDAANSKWNFCGGNIEWASGFSNLPNKADISNKTIAIYFQSDGKVKLSLNGTSKGVSSIGFGHECYGLHLGSDDPVLSGGTFYNAVVKSVKIYEGDV